MYKKYIKRLLGICISLTLIVLLSWLFVLTIILLLLCNDGVFYLQERPGKNEKIFKLIKFKTMNDTIGADGVLLPDMERITRIGSFLRKTSIDELPQLINVLIGDMSLIGPRPLLIQYLPLYSEEQRRRHEVRPGISGWAQVNGRNNISWAEKFNYDVWYVDNLSLRLDLKIFLMTILKVFKREDINNVSYADQKITEPDFDGTN